MREKKQKMYCRACGKEISTDFSRWGGEACDGICFQEVEWRQVLCMTGKEYYPNPDGKFKDKKSNEEKIQLKQELVSKTNEA
jgi:hypothetical protein